MKDSLRIYVASSWRNLYQPQTVDFLRSLGHTVYDFRNPAPDGHAFRWSDLDPNLKSQQWSVETYVQMLEHPIAKQAYALDMKGLEEADLCILLLPSGRSASWEYGYHLGRFRRGGIVYMPEMAEPELMYSNSLFAGDLVSLRTAIDIWRMR